MYKIIFFDATYPVRFMSDSFVQLTNKNRLTNANVSLNIIVNLSNSFIDIVDNGMGRISYDKNYNTVFLWQSNNKKGYQSHYQGYNKQC